MKRGFFLRQVEEHDLGVILASDIQLFLFTDSRTIALRKDPAVQGGLPAQNLQPGVTAGMKNVRNGFPRS